MNETRSDHELVESVRGGDAVAADGLVVRHHAAVFRVALGILGDEDDAADATQETFIKALQALKGFSICLICWASVHLIKTLMREEDSSA